MAVTQTEQQLSGEVVLAIQTIAKNYCETLLRTESSAIIQEELTKRDTLFGEYMREKLDSRIRSMSDDAIKGFISSLINSTLSELNGKFSALETRQQVLMTRSMPDWIVTQVEETKRNSHLIAQDIKMLSFKLDEFITKTETHNPTDSELKYLYKASGLKISAVAKFLGVEDPCAFKWVNGVFKDESRRIELASFLKKSALNKV